MNNPEPFLLRQLASLEADLDRYGRILDALRLKFMREHKCSDIEAEMLLMEDQDCKQIRRQQNQARRSWLSFNRALEKHRKANPAAPESTEVESTGAVTQEKPRAAVNTVVPPPSLLRPEPETQPIL